jgi:hypothetical protein
MKIEQIYVGANGAEINLPLTGGAKPTAVFPPQNGVNKTLFLLDSGKIAQMKGARINGIGVKRWLAEHGLVPATAGHEAAERLADYLDIQEAVPLVEDAMTKRALAIQDTQIGKTLRIVPFDRSKKGRSIIVEGSAYRTVTTMLGFGVGISGACVRADNTAMRAGGASYAADACLTEGWVVTEEEDIADFPQPSEYGDLLETASYVICNSGLAKLGARKHLEGEEAGTERGSMALELPEGESIVVGVDAMDELVVRYLDAAGQCVYERHGLEDVRLGAAVGSIAAVIVRVAEMRAAKPAKRMKKAA